jgi:hypothetical protein
MSASLSPAAAGPASLSQGPTCDIIYLRRELGRTDYSDRRMLAYVRLLIASAGFPAPLPMDRGGQLVTDPTPRSRWLRAAVDAWLENQLPPDGAALAERRAAAEAADKMDRRASNLRLVRGGKP